MRSLAKAHVMYREDPGPHASPAVSVLSRQGDPGPAHGEARQRIVGGLRACHAVTALIIGSA